MDNFMDRLVEKINLQNNSRSSYRDREDTPVREQRFEPDYHRSAETDYRRPAEIDFRKPMEPDYRRNQESPRPPRREENYPDYSGQRQTEDLEKLGEALVRAQNTGFDETKGLIRENTGQIISAIGLLEERLAKDKPAENQITVVADEERLTRQVIEEITTSGRDELAGSIGDNVHKEDVKLYRNIQAVIQEESARTMERLGALDQLSGMARLEKLDRIEAFSDLTIKRVSGLKMMMLWILIVLVLNLAGIGVLIAHLVIGVI